MQIEARKNDPQHANLPEYAGPGLPTKARNIVRELTEISGHYTEYIDDNVAASASDCCTPKVKRADSARTPTWNT